jgi:hypothetical protein
LLLFGRREKIDYDLLGYNSFSLIFAKVFEEYLAYMLLFFPEDGGRK